MKKLFMFCATASIVAMLGTTAMAATQWNFGASLRYNTFWTQVDYGKTKGPDIQGGGANLSGDHELAWSTQGNSRIKMFMKSDSLEGFIELGYDFDNNKVTTREYWGRYKFNDMGSLQIGQIHQLFNTPGLSNQVWSEDMNMHSIGVSWNPPTPKIVLNYGGFAFALAKPYSVSESSFWGKEVAEDNTNSGVTVPWARGDIDTYFPQLQAAYQYKADTWRIKLAGAYQYTKIKKFQVWDNSAATGVWGPTSSKSLHSWLVSLDGDIYFGPLYLAGAASAGENWATAEWNTTRGGLKDKYAKNKTLAMANIDYRNGKLKDTFSAMGAVIVGYALTEDLSFEMGGGYRYDDNDAWRNSSNMWNVYLQAQYTVAPGFNITPEIGYINLGRSVADKGAAKGGNAGYLWYAGAQWRMDF